MAAEAACYSRLDDPTRQLGSGTRLASYRMMTLPVRFQYQNTEKLG